MSVSVSTYDVNGLCIYIYLRCINTQAVTLLGNREPQSDVEREKVNTALLPLYLNLSFTELRLDRPHKALKYGNKALEINCDSTKALFRCGQVRRDSCFDKLHCASSLLSLLSSLPGLHGATGVPERQGVPHKCSSKKAL